MIHKYIWDKRHSQSPHAIHNAAPLCKKVVYHFSEVDCSTKSGIVECRYTIKLTEYVEEPPSFGRQRLQVEDVEVLFFLFV